MMFNNNGIYLDDVFASHASDTRRIENDKVRYG